MKTILLTIFLIPAITFGSLNNNLRFGMRSAEVLELQKILVSYGFLDQTLQTGYFGTKTLKAVTNYQIEHELPATGFVGPLTRHILNSTPASSTSVSVVDIKPEINEIPAIPTQYTVTATPQVVVTPVTQVYNVPMENPITLGTPTCGSFTREDKTYFNVKLPVTFTREAVKQGNIAIIEGTITNDTKTESAGNEFAFVSTSPLNQVMDLGDVHGTFNYTLTLKTTRGEVLSEEAGSLVINKCE